jgi:hypothetical protein
MVPGNRPGLHDTASIPYRFPCSRHSRQGTLSVLPPLHRLLFHHLHHFLSAKRIEDSGVGDLLWWWETPSTCHQAWQKYLISGIDRYRCQNRKVSIPGTQFPPLIAINFRTTSLVRKLLVAQIFYLI